MTQTTIHIRRNSTVWDDNLGEIGTVGRRIVHTGSAWMAEWSATDPAGEHLGWFGSRTQAASRLVLRAQVRRP